MHEIGSLRSKTKTEFNSFALENSISQWSYHYEVTVLSAGDRGFSGTVPVLK